MAPSTEARSPPEPIFFTYPESVFGRRLQRYLDLRSLPYTPVRVPPNMPRPVLETLGINYRRIPILALGCDVYCDTRIILRKLELLFPDSPEHPALAAKDGFGQGFEEMLEAWVINGGPFWRTSGCIPPQAPLLQNEVWVKDRSDGSGGAFNLDALAAGRAWCISQLRIFFGIMENMLKDGRKWVLGNTERPGLADIHAGWVYDWAINMGKDLFVSEQEVEKATGDMDCALGEQEFPSVHKWVKRFRETCDQAAKANSHARPLGEGQQAEEEAVTRILNGEYAESEDLAFEISDVMEFKQGQRVTITPADFGFTHSDTGDIVGLERNEVVIEIQPQRHSHGNLRLHFPRADFRITPAA